MRLFGQIMAAGEEGNICVKVRACTTDKTEVTAISDAVTSNFQIVDYSEKAIAVFGDTKAVKDKLKALDGRFNPNLTHEGFKQAGWIFSKSKEQPLRNVLTVSSLQA